MVSKKQIEAFYDSYKAGEYGEYSTKYEQEGRLSAVLSLIDLEQAGLVLDVGCGVGWPTRQYARLTQGQVTGIDSSKESINQAREKAAKEGLDNLSFQVMDAEELRFENDTFDVIICSEVLEHLLTPQKTLNEMSRVVKSTGQIVITTPNPWYWRRMPARVSGKIRGILPPSTQSIYNRLIAPLKPKRRKSNRVEVITKRQIYDQPIDPLKLNRMIRNAGLRLIKRKGTYYLPLPHRVSKFIERHNLLPYLGLYQVCLCRSSRYLSSTRRVKIS